MLAVMSHSSDPVKYEHSSTAQEGAEKPHGTCAFF